jgi:hypothetical protein
LQIDAYLDPVPDPADHFNADSVADPDADADLTRHLKKYILIF